MVQSALSLYILINFSVDAWRFGFQTLRWTEVITNGTVSRSRYGAWGGLETDRNEPLVSHGFNRHEGRFNYTYSLNVLSGEWRPASLLSNTGRRHKRCFGARAVTSSGYLMEYGGCGSGGYGPCPNDDMDAELSLDKTAAAMLGICYRGCVDTGASESG
jgi:hypothetical protein